MHENQAGFRELYSTIDHGFTLYIIFNLYKRLNKDLYMAFIDYAKAFDTIWRAGLWIKLLDMGISGKFLNIIKKMYEKSKSCVFVNNIKSDSFSSEMGVKQGEILSPLLFALYINDLESHLKGKGVQTLSGITSTANEVSTTYDLEFMLDILALFYADDTIIFSDSALCLQFALDELHDYCSLWKLVVNEGKTKILYIKRERLTPDNPTFYFNGKILEVVKEFCYLGITFTTNGLNSKTVKSRVDCGQKAMFSVLRKCKENHLPVEVSLEMFEKMVIPAMLYGSEVWGFNNFETLERLQLKFIKYLLKLKRSTPTKMIYGETGVLPVKFHVNIRMISFWVKLITGKQNKISYKIYQLSLSLYRGLRLNCKWLDKIKELLNFSGMSYVFEEQNQLDPTWLKKSFLPKIKNTMKDQILQEW